MCIESVCVKFIFDYISEQNFVDLYSILVYIAFEIFFVHSYLAVSFSFQIHMLQSISSEHTVCAFMI